MYKLQFTSISPYGNEHMFQILNYICGTFILFQGLWYIFVDVMGSVSLLKY